MVKSKRVRNGKTCCSNTSDPQQTLGVRTTEHAKDAKGTPLLRFHSLYPSKCNNKKSATRNDYYGRLRQYNGIGIDRHDVLSAITEVVEGVFK